MTTPTLLVLLVHYHNTAVTRQALAHWRAQLLPDGWRRHIVLVDNSQSWPAAATPEGVRLVVPERNLGYLNGAAYGLARYRAVEDMLPQWTILANPDITVADGFIDELAHGSWPDDVLLLAPAVRDPGGEALNPFFRTRPSRLRVRAYQVLFSIPVLHAAYRRLRPRPLRGRSASVAGPIYAAHGSLLSLRASFFERGGQLAYGGFLFGEEIHLAEQVQRLGGRVWYAPALQAFHARQSTMGRLSKREARAYHRESLAFLWATYFAEGDAGPSR